ncbi:uncharacterized protein LOC131223022 isoform X1 [Magnolia sinica]|uniref:uncharacterized protein LOC131223022 isoform X1 n=1 Tax=Magnolia sinica TaxID=86752 RepID=UPI0026582185|nr:uncharacterized protein LOC131223022 isoform X1 [Magnolia sinica]
MSEVEKMIAIGLVWGVTNAIMRRGALLWDQKLEATSASNPRRPSLLHERALAHLKKWIDLLLVWQYSIPFLVNLSASAAFFSILSDAPISLAVPVTNATTFAATAVAATALGEETRVWHALSGWEITIQVLGLSYQCKFLWASHRLEDNWSGKDARLSQHDIWSDYTMFML